MKNNIKKSLLMIGVCGLILIGCDSAIEPVVEETALENIDSSSGVDSVENNKQSEDEFMEKVLEDKTLEKMKNIYVLLK